MFSNDWKFPLNLAIGIHVVVLLGGLYLPDFFKAKPKFADIYSVSIINIAEPAPPSNNNQPEPEPVAPVKEPIKPTNAKKIAPIEEIKKLEPAPPTKVKSISLKPLKKKKKKKVAKTTPKTDEAKLKRQRLAELLKQEELLAEKARLAEEALAKERSLLERQPTPAKKQLPQMSGATTSRAKSGNQSQAGSSVSSADRMYYASIINRLHQFWALPLSLQNNPNLTSVVVVTVGRNGQILDSYFESKSGDRVFDQFVMKTVEAANPMPPIPAAMKKQRIELGLRFKPGGIQF